MKKYSPWIRRACDLALYERVSLLRPESLRALEVSGEAWKDEFSWKSFSSLSFPEYDVCESVPEGGPFDIIFIEQVLEHVRRPLNAVSNLRSALSPGGALVVSVPFIFHIHPTPLDCWRWTPQGLAFLLEDAGFSSQHIEVGSWGNLECFIRHAVVPEAPMPSEVLPMNCDPNIPQVVWAVAFCG